MPITPFLHNRVFLPEQIEVMSEAFTRACGTLGLVDRTDPITAVVAGHIIESMQLGLGTAEALHLDTMDKFKQNGG